MLKITQITTKSKIIGVLFLLAIISLVYIASSVSNSPLQSITPNTPNTLPTSNIKPEATYLETVNTGIISISEKIEIGAIPTYLPSYIGNLKTFNSKSVASLLATKLEVTPSSQVPDLWQSLDLSKSLRLDTQNDTLEYKIDQLVKPLIISTSNKPNINSSLLLTQEIINLVPEFKALTLDEPDNVYFKAGGSNLIPATKNNYDFIQFKYSQKINNIPVKVDGKTAPVITILIGPGNQIISFEINFTLLEVTSTNEVNTLLNKEELILKIKNNQAQILSSNLIDPNQLGRVNTTLEINNIGLEYRFDSSTKKIMPYFLITAIFSQSGSLPSPTILILPASKQATN